MRRLLCLVLPLLAALSSCEPELLPARPVLLSFDGSLDLEVWGQTIKLATDRHVKVTYFVSAPYFVTRAEEDAHPYWGYHEVGDPLVDFRNDNDYNRENIQRRYRYLAEAQAAGCEIGSHLCGHYNGGAAWAGGQDLTVPQWREELDYFRWAL